MYKQNLQILTKICNKLQNSIQIIMHILTCGFIKIHRLSYLLVSSDLHDDLEFSLLYWYFVGANDAVFFDADDIELSSHAPSVHTSRRDGHFSIKHGTHRNRQTDFYSFSRAVISLSSVNEEITEALFVNDRNLHAFSTRPRTKYFG